jgi:hypothetical protein
MTIIKKEWNDYIIYTSVSPYGAKIFVPCRSTSSLHLEWLSGNGTCVSIDRKNLNFVWSTYASCSTSYAWMYVAAAMHARNSNCPSPEEATNCTRMSGVSATLFVANRLTAKLPSYPKKIENTAGL